MTQRIYKYALPLAGHGLIETPLGATLFAAVHVQGTKPMLWFMVDADEPQKVIWEAYVAVTGEEFPPGPPGEKLHLDEAHYLGTFQIAKEHPFGGNELFVGHVFVFVPKGHKIRAAGQAATEG